MAHPKGQQYRVGIFVTAGIFLVLLSLYILGGSQSIFTKQVIIHGRFENVLGLNTGSVVSLAGVVIGNVEKITFVPSEKILDLELKIESTFLPRITEGSTVEIRTQGALGDKFVYINPGDPQAAPLKVGDILQAAKGSDFMGVLSERGGEATKVFDIIAELHKTVKAVNDGNKIEKIMNQFTEASAGLKRTAEESHQLVAEIRNQSSPKLKSSMEKLDRILTKIDSGDGTLGALINDSSIHDQIKSMVGGSVRKKNIKTLLRGSIEKGSVESEPTSPK